MSEVLQSLATGEGQLVDVSGLSPAGLEQIRSHDLRCPVCGRPGSIVIEESGPLFAHEADHEPEDPARQAARRALRDHMRGIIFPEAEVEENVLVGSGRADLAVVRSSGARFAVGLIGRETGSVFDLEFHQELLDQAIRPLWLLDSRRLPPAKVKEESVYRTVVFGRAECELLRLDESLLYPDPSDRSLYLVEAPAEIQVLARAGERNLGKVRCLVRRYRISNLRVRAGRWWLDRELDPEPFGDPPPLPVRITRKMEALRPPPGRARPGSPEGQAGAQQ